MFEVFARDEFGVPWESNGLFPSVREAQSFIKRKSKGDNPQEYTLLAKGQKPDAKGRPV